MMRLFHIAGSEKGMIEGMLSTEIVLSGSTTRAQIRGSVVLDEAKVLVGPAEKPVGAHATVEFEGEIGSGHQSHGTSVELILPRPIFPPKEP